MEMLGIALFVVPPAGMSRPLYRDSIGEAIALLRIMELEIEKACIDEDPGQIGHRKI
jgi:hypothetical protein